MSLESFWNNDNFKTSEQKNISFEEYYKWVLKQKKVKSRINSLENKDKKIDKKKLDIFELYFNWNLEDEDFLKKLNDFEEVQKLENKENSLLLSPEKIQNLIKNWKIELQKINEFSEKVINKIFKLNLILDISSMYKEYLQSILSNIKLKFLSKKDENYEKQIKIIDDKIRNISNLIEYINLIWNFEELSYLKF